MANEFYISSGTSDAAEGGSKEQSGEGWIPTRTCEIHPGTRTLTSRVQVHRRGLHLCKRELKRSHEQKPTHMQKGGLAGEGEEEQKGEKKKKNNLSNCRN